MLAAIKTGDVAAMRAQYMLTPKPPKEDLTWMHVCAVHGTREVIEVMYELDPASLTQESLYTPPPIMIALFQENVDALEAIQRLQGDDIDATFNTYEPTQTLAFYAATTNKPKSLERLLQMGSNINATNCNGVNLLTASIRAGSAACVSVLCRLKRRWPTARQGVAGPFHLAAQLHLAEIVRILYDAGYKKVDTLDSLKRTPLYEATMYRSRSAVVALHAIGSSAHFTPDFIGITPAAYRDMIDIGRQNDDAALVHCLYYSRSLTEILFFAHETYPKTQKKIK